MFAVGLERGTTSGTEGGFEVQSLDGGLDPRGIAQRAASADALPDRFQFLPVERRVDPVHPVG